MEFRFELATAEDDPAIRRLLRTNPVPGPVALTYEREPDSFLGCGTLGRFVQVLVARHVPSGDVAAIAARATRPLWVNGRVEEVGYLGQLRVDRRFRGRWLVAGSARFLRQLHADGRVAGYLTSIPEENLVARRLLVERRRGAIPRLRPVDTLHTLALVLRARRRVDPAPGRICRATPADLGPIVAFLREHGSARQFFPAYAEADFRGGPLTRRFRVEDFIVARRADRIVGVVGLWDQSSYKQLVVRGYGGTLGRLRPLYNLVARLGGARPLPPIGGRVRCAYASFVCVADDDPAVFRYLFRQAYNLAADRGYAYLLVGLAGRDPLLRIARRSLHIAYRARLYTVGWEDEGRPNGDDFHERLDGRVPYVEIAAL